MPPEDKPNTCSNAGVFIRKGIEGVSLDQWSKLGAVNMTGVSWGPPYIRACHQLSQTTLATSWTAARKFRAVFS